MPKSELNVDKAVATYDAKDSKSLLPSLQYEAEMEHSHVYLPDLAAVVPELAKLANNHMRKLSEGTEIYYSKMIGEITNNLEGEFPPTLNLDDQGRFIVGYYQMNKKLYPSSKDE